MDENRERKRDLFSKICPVCRRRYTEILIGVTPGGIARFYLYFAHGTATVCSWSSDEAELYLRRCLYLTVTREGREL